MDALLDSDNEWVQLAGINALDTVLNPVQPGIGDNMAWRDIDGESCWSYANHIDGPQRACTAPGYEDALVYCASTCGPYRHQVFGGHPAVRGRWGNSWVGTPAHRRPVQHLPTWGGAPRGNDYDNGLLLGLVLANKLKGSKGRSNANVQQDLEFFAEYSTESIQNFLDSR